MAEVRAHTRRRAAAVARIACRGEGAAQAGRSVPVAEPCPVQAGRSRARRRPARVGHCRTPWYLRGQTGVVVEVQGAFAIPSGSPITARGCRRRCSTRSASGSGALAPLRRVRRAINSKPTSTSTGSSRAQEGAAHMTARRMIHDHDDHGTITTITATIMATRMRRRSRITTPVRSAPTRCWRRPCARC